MKKSVKLITLSLLILLLSGCIAMFIYSKETEHLIPLDSIKFKLLKGQNENIYRVYMVYLKSRRTTSNFGEPFNWHAISVCDNRGDMLVVTMSNIYYNSESGIMYGLAITTSYRRGRYFVIGKGKIVNGEFKPTFPAGTKFGHCRQPWPYHESTSIAIHLPYPVIEFLEEKDLGKGE